MYKKEQIRICRREFKEFKKKTKRIYKENKPIPRKREVSCDFYSIFRGFRQVIN